MILHHDLGMPPPLLWCFCAHLLIVEYPDHHQILISSSLYYPGPLHKISSQSVHNFLSNVHGQTDRQTDRQTNQRYQKHNLLCQGGNKGMMQMLNAADMWCLDACLNWMLKRENKFHQIVLYKMDSDAPVCTYISSRMCIELMKK